MKVLLNDDYEYFFPLIADNEMNEVSITILEKPSFITYDPTLKKLDIRATSIAFHSGVHLVKLLLDDSKLTSEAKFYVTVRNNAPYFESELKDLKLPLNTEHEIKLPPVTEKEKFTYKITASLADDSKLPGYIIFNESNNTIKILGTNRASTQLVKICLDDNFAAAKCYIQSIKFENIRPKDFSQPVYKRELDAKFGILKVSRAGIMTIYIESKVG